MAKGPVEGQTCTRLGSYVLHTRLRVASKGRWSFESTAGITGLGGEAGFDFRFNRRLLKSTKQGCDVNNFM